MRMVVLLLACLFLASLPASSLAVSKSDPFNVQNEGVKGANSESLKYNYPPECETLAPFVSGTATGILVLLILALLALAFLGRINWIWFAVLFAILVLSWSGMKWRYFKAGGEIGACAKYQEMIRKKKAAEIDKFVPEVE